MNIDKKHYSSIAIFAVGFFLVKNELRIDGEFGFMEPIIFFVDWIIIAGIVAFVTIKWAQKKERIKYNSLPVWTASIIAILTLTANRITAYKLNAEDKYIFVTNQLREGNQDELKLKCNGNYYAEMDEIEWSYRQSGNFKINKDTLFLDKNINSDNGNTVFRKVYIFNANKNYLIPVVNKVISSDSSEYLLIEKKNKEYSNLLIHEI